MTNIPFFSIIIPVYNVEKYISCCIESLLNQDLSTDKYEIIVVNDGTPDNSMNIVDSYIRENSNIIRIDKKNGGVSSARNVGIEAAHGEYLLFVDADDAISENSLKRIVSELERRCNQLMILNSIVYKNGIKINESYKFPKELSSMTFSGIELFNKKYLRGSVCGVAFNRQFIGDYKLKFSEEIKNGEDTFFMTLSFLHAINVSHLNLDFYEVTVNENSASRVWNYNKVKDMLNNLNIINDYIDQNILTNTQLVMLNINAYSIISNSIYRFFANNNFRNYIELRSIIKNNHLYPIKACGTKLFKYKIYLLNFSIDLFCLPFVVRQISHNIRNYFILQVHLYK